jgi:hypothetical protein
MGAAGRTIQVGGARVLSVALLLLFAACAEENVGDGDGGDSSGGSGGTGGSGTGGRAPNYVVKTIDAETCLPRPLASEGGTVPCEVIEAKPPSAATCSSCDTSTGRSDALDEVRHPIEQELEVTGHCGGDTNIACSSLCLCEIEQLSGAELDTCLNSVSDPGGIYGYCYVDGSVGNPELVAACPATQRQIIRFLGENVPSPGAVAFVACSGS